jgi:Spy/CpxP family protein refolding chaperone
MQSSTNQKAALRIGGVLALVVASIGFGFALSHSAVAEAMASGFRQDMAQHMHHHGMDTDHMVAMMTDYLDLTEAQQAQVRTILTNGQPKMEALHKQLGQIHHTVMAVALQSPFDEAKVRTAIAQNLPALIDDAVEMAREHSQIYALLTPEQQTKMQHHMQREMEHGEPGSPPAE